MDGYTLRLRLSLTFLLIAGALGLPGRAAAQEGEIDGPRRVEVLAYLIDLIDVSGADQSFFADFVLEATWQDPGLAGGTEARRVFNLEDVWNPGLLIVNQRSASRSLPDVVQVDPDGNALYFQRYSGRFSVPMYLRDFPLDDQELRLWVISVPGLTEGEVELVPVQAQVLRADHLSVSDWDVGELQLELAEYRATPRARVLSGVALSIPVSRQVRYYIVQVLIPLVAVVLMSWSVYWIDPAVVATRMGVAVTTMLTLIAYRFMLGNLVPRLSYLTRLDYFMFIATSLVILTLFVMAGTSYLKTRGHDAVVDRIDSAGRKFFPVVFALLAAVVWFV